jgi:hypothetical protein
MDNLWKYTFSFVDAAQHAKRLAVVLGQSLGSGKNVWNVRLGLLESVERFARKLDLCNDQSNQWSRVIDDKALVVLLDGIRDCLQDVKYTIVRTESLKALACLLDKISGEFLVTFVCRNYIRTPTDHVFA